MFAIVTFRNEDGSYDEVGMNNRWPISDLKTERGIVRRIESGNRGKTPYRLELFTDSHAEKPFRVLYYSGRY